MEEIWKVIEDYPNYSISNLVNLRNKQLLISELLEVI